MELSISRFRSVFFFLFFYSIGRTFESRSKYFCNQALNNGLLIDPHDQKAIADALLKLVADKNLWLECRKSGIKNIHRFSWPEHCRSYLSHIENCRHHHPTNHLELVPALEEPMSESLRGVEDLSLKFSIDGDFKANGDADPSVRQQDLVEILTRKSASNGSPMINYCPGRREALYVVATDCYNSNGCITETLSSTIKNIKQAMGSRSSQIGLVLLTGLTLSEVIETFKSSQVKLEELDALVCGSGSEVYYPWKDLVIDEDYEAHNEYRWPSEHVKSMVKRLAKVEGAAEDDIEHCTSASNSRCYSYTIRPGSKVLFPNYSFHDHSSAQNWTMVGRDYMFPNDNFNEFIADKEN